MPKQRAEREVRSAHNDANKRRRDADEDDDVETEPESDEYDEDEVAEPGDEGDEPEDDGDEQEVEESADEEQETKQRSGRSRRRSRDRSGGLSAAEAADAGMRALAELIGKEPQGVTSVKPADGGWDVGVEVLEDSRVPSSADLLALYEAELDDDGTLLSYRRVQRYQRGRGEG